MPKPVLVAIPLFLLGIFFVRKSFGPPTTTTGAPPYVIEDLQPPDPDPHNWLREWQRPDGPPRVGLQAGHWKNQDLPPELDRLIGNTGATATGITEWEVNLAIAEHTKSLLEKHQVVVDLLPATIPPQYWADVFVAIHADGSEDNRTTGYKIATPRRDYTGNANQLLNLIQEHYGQSTRLSVDPNVTRNMRGYYAFAWWRYEHAVHPMTASVILETGFLTNPSDRHIIVSQPESSAIGLAAGIIKYLQSQRLLPDQIDQG